MHIYSIFYGEEMTRILTVLLVISVSMNVFLGVLAYKIKNIASERWKSIGRLEAYLDALTILNDVIENHLESGKRKEA